MLRYPAPLVLPVAVLLLPLLLLPLRCRADIEITSPRANTVWEGDSTVEMSWKDNGAKPELKDFGTYSVYLCWGSNGAPVGPSSPPRGGSWC